MGSHKANHGQNYRRMCSEDGIEGTCFLNYLCCEFLFCPFGACQVLRVRQKIREELKLPQKSFGADCLKAFFCLGCMVLENRQTIKANKIDLSSKGKFNVAATLVGAIVNQPK